MNRAIRTVFAACLCVLSATMPATAQMDEAGEAYVFPSFAELTQTMVLLGGMDVNDKHVVDEYIRLMYCDLYKKNYQDDFAWHTLKRQITSQILSKKEYYRTLYQVGIVLNFKKYDFGMQAFPLTEESVFDNVGAMNLFSNTDFKSYCDVGRHANNMRPEFDRFFPRDVSLTLSYPLTLKGLKVSSEEAAKILERMEKLKINNRQLYARIRMRVHAVDSVEKAPGGLRGQIGHSKAYLSGEITSVDLFYDEDMTMWVARVPHK